MIRQGPSGGISGPVPDSPVLGVAVLDASAVLAVEVEVSPPLSLPLSPPLLAFGSPPQAPAASSSASQAWENTVIAG